MFKPNRQEIYFIGISFLEVGMKVFYKSQEVLILDKSCDLVLVEFTDTKKTTWLREELLRFSY